MAKQGLFKSLITVTMSSCHSSLFGLYYTLQHSNVVWKGALHVWLLETYSSPGKSQKKIVVAIIHFMDRLRVKGLQLEGRVQGTVLTILYISCLCNNIIQGANSQTTPPPPSIPPVPSLIELLWKWEMQELVNLLFSTEHPYYCPHGRPIIIKLSLEELDKRFERI